MSNTYRIETLSDIYALPSADAMRRCLDEIALLLPQARAYNDLLGECAGGKKLVGFPGYIQWTDDGKYEGTYVIEGPKGEALSTLRLKRDEAATTGATPPTKGDNAAHLA